MKYAGQYAAEKKPDVIICLGDFADMESLSSYDVGKKAFEGRTYLSDIEAAKEAMSFFMYPIMEEQARLRRNKDKQWNPRLVLTLGNHCLSSDTQTFVIGKGWVDFTEIDVGDMVVTMGDNNTYECNPVKDVVKWFADEDLYTSDTVTNSMNVTGGHRVYYRTCNGTLKVKEAKEFRTEFDVVTSTNSASSYELTNEELQIAAWLCTDSCYDKYGCVTLYQRLSNAHKIRNLLDNLGVVYNETHRDRDIKEICGKTLKKRPEIGVEFRLSKEASVDLKDRVEVYTNTRLPKLVWKLSNAQWDIFLETLIDADGSIPTRATTSRVFYGRKDICEDVQIQAHLHGWRGSLTEYRPNQFRVNLTKRSVSRTRLEKKHYSGMVWCITVDNSNFLVRRNNKLQFTGNCDRINKAINNDRKLEGLISVADLPYESYGWEVIPFLEVINIDGILYSHYFVTGVMGRPVASARMLVTKKHMSCTMGHIQNTEIDLSQRRGDGKPIIGLFAGIYYQHDEAYLNAQSNKQHRQIWMKYEVEDGFYYPHAISLEYLMKKYN